MEDGDARRGRASDPAAVTAIVGSAGGQLTAEEQQVLEVGSVAGAEFTLASVAAGMGSKEEEIEAVCERLAQRGQFIAERELETWPDGTVSGRYGFRHALYQEVLYQRLSASRRVRLHRQIGERIEAGYGERATEVAAELAVHFERGQDYERAVHYLRQAGDNALGRNAHAEAVALLSHAVDLLDRGRISPNVTSRTLPCISPWGRRWWRAKATARRRSNASTVVRQSSAGSGRTTRIGFDSSGLGGYYMAHGEFAGRLHARRTTLALGPAEPPAELRDPGATAARDAPVLAG